MARIEEHIDIAAATATVFLFCHDITRRPDWDECVVRVKLLSAPPLRSGTLIRVDTRHSGGFVFTWEGEYSAFQFPSSSTVRVLDAAPSSPFGVGSTEKWTFSSAGGGTRFTLVWNYQPQGFLRRIADRLGGRASTRRAIKRSLANLKTMIELDPSKSAPDPGGA